MYCFKCGSTIPEGSEFCMHCGTKQPIATDQFNSNQVRELKKTVQKKDIFTTICLLFALGSLGLPITFISMVFNSSVLNNELSLIQIIGILVGVFTFIPAAILSLVALILGIRKKKKGTIAKKKFIIRVASFCMAIVLPIVTIVGLACVGKQLNYSRAFEAYEARDYARADELFSNLNDYKDSEKNAKECRYLEAVELAKKKQWKEARAIFQLLAAENYKASQALDVYCDIFVNAELRASMVENELYSYLKNPASYSAISKSYSFVVSPRSEEAIDVVMNISIKYSATNSFGGRVTDVYTGTKNVVFSDLYDFTAEEINAMLLKTVHQIASEYSNSSESDVLLIKPDEDVISSMRTSLLASVFGVTTIIFVVILVACGKVKQVGPQQTEISAQEAESNAPAASSPIASTASVASNDKRVGKCIVCGREGVPLESVEVKVAGMTSKRAMCSECAARYK